MSNLSDRRNPSESNSAGTCVELELASGDRARVSLQGAQTLSWRSADGVEQLYLSPSKRLTAATPIRGGVPICFPQFNQRRLEAAELPKHGFARTLRWKAGAITSSKECCAVSLELDQDGLPAVLRPTWKYHFTANMTVTLWRNQLRMKFRVMNTGREPWPFALALHTYLRVSDIETAQVHGLGGIRYWDAVENLADPAVTKVQFAENLVFTTETDRVYKSPPNQLHLRDAERRVLIEQSSNFSETVVWNPGRALCAQLGDMPPDGYRHMLCIEAAKIDEAVVLAAGQTWEGSQQLTVLD